MFSIRAFEILPLFYVGVINIEKELTYLKNKNNRKLTGITFSSIRYILRQMLSFTCSVEIFILFETIEKKNLKAEK